ncbi:GNAT family N-acetyltransferase [Mesotoga prima]|uniref:GNAT family N-acetyltransferase n=1 Tax=Mesotoga prima TaxID=1184387 RepID=UPI002C0B327D|nr:GNAT family N-acetyltransferase [Mesotoga prima]HPJ32588.1 GNAT family N-acetyltransferase [Mesotoga prima]
MIVIEKMRSDEFSVYLRKLVENYAVENVKSGRWEEKSALEKSKREVDSLLTDGLNTENHELLNLKEKDTGKKIGCVWLHIFPGMEKKGFIYDFVIDEAFRGKGYGKESLKALE